MFIVAKTKNLLGSLKSRISHSKNKKAYALWFATIVFCVPLAYVSIALAIGLFIPIFMGLVFTRPKAEQFVGGLLLLSFSGILLYLRFVLNLSFSALPDWITPELLVYFFSYILGFILVQLFYLFERIEPKVTAFLQPIFESALTRASITWIITKDTLQNLNTQLQSTFLLAKRIGQSVVWTIKIILRLIIWFFGPFKPVLLVCVRIPRLFVPETLIMMLTCVMWIMFSVQIAIRMYPFSLLFTEWLMLELAVWLFAYIFVRIYLLFKFGTKIPQ